MANIAGDQGGSLRQRNTADKQVCAADRFQTLDLPQPVEFSGRSVVDWNKLGLNQDYFACVEQVLSANQLGAFSGL